MRIGLYPNPGRDPGLRITEHTATLIHQLGGEAVIDLQTAGRPIADALPVDIDAYASCDCLISIGGDGTFLSAVHLPDCESVPIIGINLGSVGFLPEIRPEALEPSLRQLVSGPWHLEKRMMLQIIARDPDGQTVAEGYALNDAVISRGGRSRIVTLELTIGQDLVDRLPGDGLIVSTPTGSTAYSLSSGGPIVHPEMELMLMTPICPHTLHNRSYIAQPDSRVHIRVVDYPHDALLAIDGRQEIGLASGSNVLIRRSARSLRLIRLGPDRFYNTLPDKIQARGIAT